MLVEAPDLRKPEGRLEKRVQHVKARAVGGEPGALDRHAAEEARVDAAIFLAAPGAAPVLELHQLARAALDEVLDHVLVAQPVATRYGVVEVLVEAVVLARDARGAAFGGHGVAAHRQHLGDERDAQARILLGGCDRGAQARAASAHHPDIGPGRAHYGLVPVRSWYRPPNEVRF